MGDVIGLEDELIWLPSHLLQEDSSDHPNSDKPTRKHHHRFYHRHHRRPIVSPAENAPLNWRVQPKQKNQSTNWKRNGDERMQAFFLASGPATSGTGVFLPTTASCPSKKKPACAPVLLPSRVVQALNLNVHSLGLQVSPRPDGENGSRKKNRVEGSTGKSGEANLISSPEMVLPEEWTY
ncbi:PREDICTED: uncharacterized protein LOC104825998 isoform X3 [Tarenaya hassleriana]|uniref:uncharacterized protein LOC104825998 isoform X3 n=1 Tax=Tarenaya hassleriana TaxID=28532 RepID=UPI00053C15B1|nr:PREDICTED: uncharacterized protein LOC104825998 isoform X3 [Tarenaya hassleriana]